MRRKGSQKGDLYDPNKKDSGQLPNNWGLGTQFAIHCLIWPKGIFSRKFTRPHKNSLNSVIFFQSTWFFRQMKASDNALMIHDHFFGWAFDFRGDRLSAILSSLEALGPGPCGGPLKQGANLKPLWNLLIWLKNLCFLCCLQF